MRVSTALYLIYQLLMFPTYVGALYTSCFLVEPLASVRRSVRAPLGFWVDAGWTALMLLNEIVREAGLEGSACLSRVAHESFSNKTTGEWCASAYPPWMGTCVWSELVSLSPPRTEL